jgi:hypothetical protein
LPVPDGYHPVFYPPGRNDDISRSTGHLMRPGFSCRLLTVFISSSKTLDQYFVVQGYFKTSPPGLGEKERSVAAMATSDIVLADN